MTTHRRGWLLRTGLVALLTAGGLAVVASPALADDTIGVSVNPMPDFTAGQTQSLQVTVTYKKTLTKQDTVTVTVNQLNNVTVSDAQKTVNLSATNTTANVTFSVKATSNVQPGQTANGTGTVTVKDGLDPTATDSAQFQAVIHGPDAAPSPTPTTVPSVTGTVKDRATGAAVADAQVTMQDDERHTFTTGTNNAGAFTFTSSPGNPISPGTLAFVVTKDGYDQRSLTADAKAGQPLNIPIVLAATAASASAAPTDSTSPSPADSPGAVVAPTVGAAGGSGGGFSSLLIVMGAILVLLGVGAIGLILWRRKSDNSPPEDDETGSPRRGPTPVPASRGAYRGAPAEATSVMRGGGGGYGDPTAVARPLAEAPTMMHRPVADEYPDPYGAPDPRNSPNYGNQTQYQGGYGAPAGGYTAPGGGYGSPGGFGSPAGNPGYTDPTRYEPPASGGGYGAQGGYDSQPAGGYPRPADPYGTTHAQGHDYGAGSSGYGPTSGGGYDQGGYESGGGYNAAGGGYQQDSTRRYDGGGAGNGYDPQPQNGGYSGQAGYQPAPGGGYQPDRGYSPPASGYGDQRGGGYQGESGGYGNDYEPRGGYQQRGGYPQQQRGGYDAQPEQRRSLDWLDD